ncbi:MAG TPA: FAD-dependent oxidoreductase [Phycisphaerae bacterium]|nr:FAD-dependent oxidoreductase [Phycisphaerae bacterium]HOM53564.1 FAD-dependent oxidoreductase [Phycisphaerae bacterium]HOQ86942.1 FAD-dependent oxidoreductase [Phycisphaerae bacterium]HPP28848.1 FAD-dependent oxidoreductase [Phycisphaerae bacterium]
MGSPRILIVGGVAAGASAATRARRVNEHAEIVMFEAGEHVSFANCGLPYYIAGSIADRAKLLLATPEYFKRTFNIDARTGHEVLEIDRAGKRVQVLCRATGERIWERYDKLILAPGASPIVPPWPGVKSSNVFSLRDVPDADRVKSYVDARQPKRAVLIGAGFIGLEMVEVLTERGVAVTLVEQQRHVLPVFDEEMAAVMEAVLARHGVELRLGQTLEKLTTDGDRVTDVRLSDGSVIPADMVLLAMGVRPNVKLAANAGLTIGPSGGIAVNEYSQTSDPDIYAVGDAAEVMHGVLGRAARIPLAGPANRNGRLAGEHAATGRSARTTPVLGTAIVGAFGKVAASTGMTVRAARQAGYNVGFSYAIRGHHVGYYPGAEQMILKLVYEQRTRRVLGAQAVGGAGVDKRIDVVATVLHFRGTIDDLAGLDLAYAPQFGAAKDPLHIAAFVAQNQEDGLLRQAGVDGLPADAQLIDVRSEQEFRSGALAGAVNVPLPALRSRLDELDRNRPVYVYCRVGQRGYVAARILAQHGFADVWNIYGGVTLNLPKEAMSCGL